MKYIVIMQTNAEQWHFVIEVTPSLVDLLKFGILKIKKIWRY